MVYRTQGIAFLCAAGRASSVMLLIESDNNSTSFLFAKSKFRGNPAISQAFWAIEHLNKTWSIDSVPFKQSLQRVSRYIPRKFNLSVTVSAPEATLQMKLRIFGNVGIDQIYFY